MKTKPFPAVDQNAPGNLARNERLANLMRFVRTKAADAIGVAVDKVPAKVLEELQHLVGGLLDHGHERFAKERAQHALEAAERWIAEKLLKQEPSSRGFPRDAVEEALLKGEEPPERALDTNAETEARLEHAADKRARERLAGMFDRLNVAQLMTLAKEQPAIAKKVGPKSKKADLIALLVDAELADQEEDEKSGDDDEAPGDDETPGDGE